MALTKKQALFVHEYLIDKNATQAAIRAGYSLKTAYSIGHENLTKPEIRARLQEAMEKLANSLEITAERTLRERARLAYFDIGEIARANPQKPEDIANLPRELRQAVAGWKWDKDGRFIVEFIDKSAHLTALDKHLGLYEKDNLQKSGVADLSDEELDRLLTRRAKDAGISLH